MRTIELFCGTKSFSKVMEAYGHETFTVDNDPVFEPDACLDLRTAGMQHLQLATFGRSECDILWASPPCEGFSVASIGANWTGGFRGYEPKSDSARRSILLAKNTIGLIRLIEPRYWFIENPRGLLRKMRFMEDLESSNPTFQPLGIGVKRVTISYCQYGDTRMKPTDIWTNAWWWTPRPICKNGMPCHVAAPRGSKTGTQGIGNYRDRSRIPAALFEEILEQMKTVL